MVFPELVLGGSGEKEPLEVSPEGFPASFLMLGIHELCPHSKHPKSYQLPLFSSFMPNNSRSVTIRGDSSVPSVHKLCCH